MADIYFNCDCGKSLAVDEVGAGRTVQCVDCGQPVQVPLTGMEFICAGCGRKLVAGPHIGGRGIKCTFCGHQMRIPDIDPYSGIAVNATDGGYRAPAYAKMRSNVSMLAYASLTLAMTGIAVRVLLGPRAMESAPESMTDIQPADTESMPRCHASNGETDGIAELTDPDFHPEPIRLFEHIIATEESITDYAPFTPASGPEDEWRHTEESPAVELEDTA